MEKINLINQINQKTRELNKMKDEYNQEIEKEKTAILKEKNKGFKKSLYLLSFDFKSSTQQTEQYKEFHRVFRNELKAVLKPYIKELLYNKLNHFDISGFFKLNDDRIFYFSISDLRWNKEDLFIRTAEHFKDYSGGSNNFIILNKDFEQNLKKFLKV